MISSLLVFWWRGRQTVTLPRERNGSHPTSCWSSVSVLATVSGNQRRLGLALWEPEPRAWHSSFFIVEPSSTARYLEPFESKCCVKCSLCLIPLDLIPTGSACWYWKLPRNLLQLWWFQIIICHGKEVTIKKLAGVDHVTPTNKKQRATNGEEIRSPRRRTQLQYQEVLVLTSLYTVLGCRLLDDPTHK